jgi:hypothetical protein
MLHSVDYFGLRRFSAAFVSLFAVPTKTKAME